MTASTSSDDPSDGFETANELQGRPEPPSSVEPHAAAPVPSVAPPTLRAPQPKPTVRTRLRRFFRREDDSDERSTSDDDPSDGFRTYPRA